MSCICDVCSFWPNEWIGPSAGVAAPSECYILGVCFFRWCNHYFSYFKDNLQKAKREQVNSRLSEYQTENHVTANWDDTYVLTKESNANIRKIKEALYVENVSLPSRDVGQIWNKVIKREITKQCKPQPNPNSTVNCVT
jgi:hypothetical protein